jgi:hypothetical protein
MNAAVPQVFLPNSPLPCGEERGIGPLKSGVYSHIQFRICFIATQQNKVVAGTERGDTAINVQKLPDRPWYKYKHLRKLYAWLSVVLIVQATNGLDGSIMNGMPTLPYWQAYFGHPTGARLGNFNGTQGLGGVGSQFFLCRSLDNTEHPHNQERLELAQCFASPNVPLVNFDHIDMMGSRVVSVAHLTGQG